MEPGSRSGPVAAPAGTRPYHPPSDHLRRRRRTAALVLPVIILTTGCGQPRRAPAPPGPTAASPSPPEPGPGEVASAISDRQIRKFDEMARDSATKLNKDHRSINPPYPWTRLPAEYRQLVADLRDAPNEALLWMDHGRRLSIPYTYLADAVSRHPEDPDAPFLLTIDQQNPKQGSFEQAIRSIGHLLARPPDTEPRPIPARIQLGILFLIMSGDTREAQELLASLPAPAAGEAGEEDRSIRVLCRTLLRWNTKGSPTPVEQALEGLRLLGDPPVGARSWDWGLITVYGSVLSMFHQDYGLRVTVPEYYHRAMRLSGCGPGAPAVPAQVQGYLVQDIRWLLFETAQRGIKEFAPLLLGSSPAASEAQVIEGNRVAGWSIATADLEANRVIGSLWFNLFNRWMLPLHRLFRGRTGGPTAVDARSAAVATSLGELEAALTAREEADRSGVATAARAALRGIAGDATAARDLLVTARQEARAHPHTADDEEIQEFLDELGTALGAPKGP